MSMQSIIEVNPFRCRMWDLHDRMEQSVTEETCRAEIESVRRHGLLVAVLGRPLRNDPDYDIELIYGARRLFVARHLNKQLLVDLREIDDKEGLIAMDIENRHRVDISPYERGQSYSRWLRVGHFKSQDELAGALRISSSQVSRLLKVARLPAAVVGAFESPVDICEGWGVELSTALEDASRRQTILDKARAIACGRRPPAREIYRQLLTAPVRGRKIRPKHRDDVIKNREGEPLFRIRLQTNTIAILLPVTRVSAPLLKLVTDSITSILGSENAQKS